MDTGVAPASSPPPLLRVSIGTQSADRLDFEFRQPFRIGRGEECEVCFKNDYISRMHAEVFFDSGQWWIRDLNSSNGIFAGGQRVDIAPIGESAILRLGIEGPALSLKIVPEAAPPPPPKPAAATRPDAMAHVAQRYFGELKPGDTIGEHTAMVRQVFQQVQARQKRKYGRVMIALAVVIIAVAGYALYLQLQVRRQKELAQDLFYSMKSVDLDIAGVENQLAASNNPEAADAVRKYQSRRAEMQKSYDRFLSALHVYDTKLTEPQRLILRVARIFGECELAMPPEFATEVEAYIHKWQSSGRLAAAIQAANDKGYTRTIANDLLAQDLPPQFFYLALQESSFDPYIAGPMTRKGIAKGMWQFIPETAIKYGLQLGPLVDFRRPDPGDDRDHWDRETVAAARYIKDLYSTDAQASGLLVMACYNWGEDQVLPLVRSLPLNPKERNYWRLLAADRNKIPQETYDYVLYIVSAAVIGENPRLFGFNFDDPLAHLENK